MSLTDIPSSKAPRDQRSDSCLHCVLMTIVEEWYRQHAERHQGKVLIDATEAIAKLAECIVDVVNEVPDRNNRRRAMRFAHDALDATMKSSKVGKLVAVDVPSEH